MEKSPDVLVIDSGTGLFSMVKKALGNSFTLTEASDSNEGLKKAKVEMPDLVILGYLEPRGSSFKLHKELSEGLATKNIPQLVVDVRPEEHSRKGWTVSEGMQIIADDYISRPIDPDELEEIVNRIIQRTITKPIELGDVLEQMEVALRRIDKIEKLLVR